MTLATQEVEMTNLDQHNRRVLPVREIGVLSTGRTDRPISLIIGLETPDGSDGGAAHGVLLANTSAYQLLFDLATELRLAVCLPPELLPWSAPGPPHRNRTDVGAPPYIRIGSVESGLPVP
jgi:hypothetical protein